MQGGAVDGRPEGFEQVQGETVAMRLVGVHDAERRVQPDDLAGMPGDALPERVAVVQHRVDGASGHAGAPAFGKRGRSRDGFGPAQWEASTVAGRERSSGVRGPDGKVDAGGVRFDFPKRVEGVQVIHACDVVALGPGGVEGVEGNEGNEGDEGDEVFVEDGCVPGEFGLQESVGDVRANWGAVREGLCASYPGRARMLF